MGFFNNSNHEVMNAMKKILFLTIFLLLFIGCKGKKAEDKTSKTEIPEKMLKTTVVPEEFVGLVEGDSVKFYSLTNANGIEVELKYQAGKSFDAFANYSFVDGDNGDEEDGNQKGQGTRRAVGGGVKSSRRSEA